VKIFFFILVVVLFSGCIEDNAINVGNTINNTLGLQVVLNTTNLAPTIVGESNGTGERIADNRTYWSNNSNMYISIYAHANTTGDNSEIHLYINGTKYQDQSGKPIGIAEQNNKSISHIIPQHAYYSVEVHNAHHYVWFETQLLSGNARVALYNNSGFAPVTLLNESGSQTLIAGWNNFSVVYNITAGNEYWLATQMSNVANVNYRNANGALRFAAQAYGAFPTTAPALTSGTRTLNMRITIETPENQIPVIVSDNIKYSNDTEVINPVVGPALVNSFTITHNYTGTYNISFELYKTTFNSKYGQIYKNNITFGTNQTLTDLSTWVQYNETFSSNVSNNDIFQLYTGGPPGNVNSRNFRMLFNYDYVNFTPELTYPTNGSTVNFNYPPQYGDINFTWSNISGSSYNLIIGKDINFNLIAANVTTSNNYYTQSLEQGVYYWKVKTLNAGYADGNYSNIFSFTHFPVTAASVNNSSQGIVYQLIDNQISTISGVKVELYNSMYYTYQITGSNGYYLFTGLSAGTYNLKASKTDDFDDSPTIPVTIVLNTSTTTNILMQKCTSVFNCFYNKQWVTFAVQDIYFNRYSDVSVSVYKGNEATLDNYQVTDTAGKVNFLMIKNQYYRIVLLNTSQGISQTSYITAADNFYVLIISPTQSYFTDPDNANDYLTIVPSSTIVNTTHAYMNISYLNSTGYSSQVTINVIKSNVDGSNTTVNTTTATGNNMSFSYLASNYAGNSYTIELIIYDSAIVELYHYKYGFTFQGMSNNPYAGNTTFLGIIAIAIILFVASFFSESTAGIGGVIISGVGLLLSLMGFMNASFFGSYLDIGLGICLIISIMHVINTKNSKEGFS